MAECKTLNGRPTGVRLRITGGCDSAHAGT